MCCGNNWGGNNCLWIILILIILFGCGNGCGNSYNSCSSNSCGCNDGCSCC